MAIVLSAEIAASIEEINSFMEMVGNDTIEINDSINNFLNGSSQKLIGPEWDIGRSNFSESVNKMNLVQESVQEFCSSLLTALSNLQLAMDGNDFLDTSCISELQYTIEIDRTILNALQGRLQKVNEETGQIETDWGIWNQCEQYCELINELEKRTIILKNVESQYNALAGLVG